MSILPLPPKHFFHTVVGLSLATPLPPMSERADEEQSLREGGQGAAETEDPPVEVARPHVQAEVGERHRG